MESPQGEEKKAVKERVGLSYEKFDIQRMQRSLLKAAPYNPRVISDAAREKLRKNLKKFGLVKPIVWNKRTGTIVEGHQRIDILDSLYRTIDYELTVAVVDLDEKSERELNVFLNNTAAMGQFDLPKLKEVLSDGIVDIELTGFDMGDIYQTFGENILVAKPEVLANMANKLRELKEAEKEVTSRVSTDEGGQDADVNFYVVLVFKNHAHRANFMQGIGEQDNKYLDGRKMERLLMNAKGGDNESVAVEEQASEEGQGD